jgi:hypothetical protein
LSRSKSGGREGGTLNTPTDRLHSPPESGNRYPRCIESSNGLGLHLALLSATIFSGQLSLEKSATDLEQLRRCSPYDSTKSGSQTA